MRNTPNNETLIVEYGFLDNTRDANRLKNNYKDYVEAVVKAVADYGGYNYRPVAGSGLYVVKRGDTLWSIARNYGLTVDELKALNNLTSNTLSVGDTLIVKSNEPEVPQDVGGYQYYTVESGDTLYSIARRYGLTLDQLKAYNNLTSNILSVGQRLIVGETTTGNLYTVQRGDTLYSIARNFGVTIDDLRNANNLGGNILSIGQVLIIPSNGSSNNINTNNVNTYRVKRGDTLYNIANTFNTTVSEIKELNNLVSNVLSIGQELILPR